VLAQDDRDTDTDLTGEWPVNWSLASYEDVGEFFQNNLFKESAQPGKTLSAVMAKDVRSVTPDTKLETLRSLFDRISGVPVVRSDSDKTLVGVLSRKDMQGASASATVKEVMSTPPIAAKPDNKVADAAVLMLKHKVHRIPVVDAQAKLVGIVTRTDIFTALATETGM
jgi:CBS domain-containing protein